MKDIGLGIFDPYTVVIVLITLVLSQVLLGYQIPLNTTDATQLFVSLTLFTGYIYAARSVIRLPVAIIKATIYIHDSLKLTDNLRHIESGSQKIMRLLKKLARWIWYMPRVIVHSLSIILDFSGNLYADTTSRGALRPLVENLFIRHGLTMLDRISIVLIAFLAVLPAFQKYFQMTAVIGLVVMTFVFILKGNFSALLVDSLGKAPEGGEENIPSTKENHIQTAKQQARTREIQMQLEQARAATQPTTRDVISGEVDSENGTFG